MKSPSFANRRNPKHSSSRKVNARRQPRRGSTSSTIHAFAANLRLALRSILLRPVDSRAWSVSAVQLISLAAMFVVLNIALQRTFYSADAIFNWQAMRGQWLELAVFLLVGWLAARLATSRIDPLTIPIALFAALVVVDVVLAAALHVTTRVWPQEAYRIWGWVYYGWFVWFLSIVLVLLRRTAKLAYGYVVLAVVPVIVLSAYEVLFPSVSIWYEPPPALPTAVADPGDSPVSETMLSLQPRLFAQTLKAVARQRRGVTDLYFVGFAPYASEDVFMKEVEVIRDLMDTRFDTRNRSVLLVNNDRTLRKYPLATVTNLRATLQRIGRRINPKEDVVMIYLTSHGDKAHHLSSSYAPLELDDLTPTVLKELLDDAGIRWRVIVVSACYAGGFIEPLRGPTTLVMTAADATHTSFGCGAASDFTYFAKALFDEQLRTTRSLERAFMAALPVIREREREQGQEFSNPQIALGEKMRAKLAEIERRLARAN